MEKISEIWKGVFETENFKRLLKDSEAYNEFAEARIVSVESKEVESLSEKHNVINTVIAGEVVVLKRIVRCNFTNLQFFIQHYINETKSDVYFKTKYRMQKEDNMKIASKIELVFQEYVRTKKQNVDMEVEVGGN